MPLLLKWHAGEISLLQSPSEGSSVGPKGDVVGQISLGKVALDFNLSPLTLASDEDRRRLVAVLGELRQSSATWETSVFLQIPAIWGVTLRLPELDLPPEELALHLHWELSRALLDPVDQYRYHYAFAADNSIRLGALRSRLLDLIQEVTTESGFQLQGIYFDDERFSRVNLLEASSRPRAALPTIIPRPWSEPEPEPELEKPIIKQAKPIGTQPPWFLAAVIIAGLIVVTLWGWMKLTSERRPTVSPPIVQPEVAVPISPPQIAEKHPQEPAPADTAKIEVARPDTAVIATAPPPAPPQIVPEEPSPGELSQTLKTASYPWARTSQRLVVLETFWGDAQGDQAFDLISFTGDRFLVQMPASTDAANWEAAVTRMKALSGLKEVKFQRTSSGDAAKGSISAKLAPDSTAPASQRPAAAALISLAGKHSLQRPPSGGLIFTGRRADMMGFLNDVATQDYAVYRLILVPWGQEEYRMVLEF